MHIKPISQLSREEIRDMAHAAVLNGTPMADANPFEAGSSNHAHFEHDFQEYDRELAIADG